MLSNFLEKIWQKCLCLAWMFFESSFKSKFIRGENCIPDASSSRGFLEQKTRESVIGVLKDQHTGLKLSCG